MASMTPQMEVNDINEIKFQQLTGDDEAFIKLIAGWYFSEWNIATSTTEHQLSTFPTEGIPFQVVMNLNDVPVATGGVYEHVGLLDREPRLKIYGPWLALVYTKNEYRNLGYGAKLCNYIESVCSSNGLKEYFLFTHTAESLYKRLGWQQVERITLNGKDIVVMRKTIIS